MKVGYIGNFKVPFSTESHVAADLEALGHVVVRVQEDTVDWPWLHVSAQRSRVDFVLWTHTHAYADESTHDDALAALGRLREAGIPTVSYHLDRWWGLAREHQAREEPYFRTDLVITADGDHDEQWRSIGVNHLWLPPAVVSSAVYRGTQRSIYRKQVGFVGGWKFYPHADEWPWRFRLVSKLHHRYGSTMRAWPRGGAPIRETELNDLYASCRVIVGDSCLAGGVQRYWSDRVPETIGRGGFLLHPRTEGIDEWYPADLLPWHIPVGDTAGVYEVVERALALSDKDRVALIDESMKHAERWHTYKVRMARVVELVEGMKR